MCIDHKKIHYKLLMIYQAKHWKIGLISMNPTIAG